MPQAIQGVLFDYGLVLTAPPDPAAWARMQQITGLTEAALHQAYWAPRLDYDRGHHTGKAYWQTVGHHAGLTLSPSQIGDLLAADNILWTQVNPPMVDWVARLQSAGTPTGILSNLGDDMSQGVLAAFPWMAHFTFRLWSHTLKMAKPQPEIYRHAAQGMGLPPQALLFVDDREDNIVGALAVGMQAIRYTGQASFERALSDCGLLELWQSGKVPERTGL